MASPVKERSILPSYPTLTRSLDDLPATATVASDNVPNPVAAAAQQEKFQYEVQPHNYVQTPAWIPPFLKTMPELAKDQYSNACPQDAVTDAMSLSFDKIDFEKKEIDATVTYSFTNRKNVDSLILDVYGTKTEEKRAQIEVSEVLVNGETAKWSIQKTGNFMPDALKIAIPNDKRLGVVQIKYKTTPEAKGLYWRTPEETDGKTHPMLFTQAEALDGASFVPGQHSPQIRMTYDFTIKTGKFDDPAKRLLAVGSAMNNPTKKSESGEYTFKMTHPIPLYLLGLAIGNFEYHGYDKATGVYAEPCKLNTVAEKFNRLPKILETAEKILGKYQWLKYAPVRLTYSYPYGAMEHPCCSFLGGDVEDRIYVVIHELVHSWLGNWVTNGTWEEIVWNEGFTSYVEYLITRECLGEDMAAQVLKTRYESALKSMKDFKEKGKLHETSLCRKHRDEEFDISVIPYSKGQHFFLMLEKAIGTEKMYKFIKDYTNAFALKSMSKDRFVAFLKLWVEKNHVTSNADEFMEKHLVEEWLTGEGTEFPKNCPVIEANLTKEIDSAREKAIKGEDISVEFEKFKKQEPVILQSFYSSLDSKISKENLQKYDEQFKISENEKNILILSGWAPLCASANYLTDKTKAVIQGFIYARQSQKYTTDIVNNLIKTPEGRAFAVKIYQEGSKLDSSHKQLLEKLLPEVKK